MCRFRVWLSLIYIREPYFRSIMTSHMPQGSRARTRQRVETGFGSGWRWRSISPPVSFRIAKSIETQVWEGRARHFSHRVCSSLLHLAFTIYALPSIPRNLRRVLRHYRIVLAEQKTRSTPGYSWFNANTARKLALNQTADVIFVEIHGKCK